MLNGRRFLAIVPARSGSKGVPHKNMRKLGGVSLIGRAGRCLGELAWIDRAVISTDSPEYAAEGERFGLDAPFLRPQALSTDRANAVDAAIDVVERLQGDGDDRYDYILLVEPTSPFRQAVDIERVARALVDSSAEAAMCVSKASTKCHPLKILRIEDERIRYYDPRGASIVARQELDTVYVRNGVCYGVARDCLCEKKTFITDDTVAVIIDRLLVNIDDPIDMEWAEFLLSKQFAELDHG